MLEKFAKGKEVKCYQSGQDAGAKKARSNRLAKHFLQLGLVVTMAAATHANAQAQKYTRYDTKKPKTENTNTLDKSDVKRFKTQGYYKATKDAIGYLETQELCTPEQAAKFRAMREVVANMDIDGARTFKTAGVADDLRAAQRAYSYFTKTMKSFGTPVRDADKAAVNGMLSGLRTATGAVSRFQKSQDPMELLCKLVLAENSIGGNRDKDVYKAVDAAMDMRDAMDKCDRNLTKKLPPDQMMKSYSDLTKKISAFDNHKVGFRNKIVRLSTQRKYSIGLRRNGENELNNMMKAMEERSKSYRKALQKQFGQNAATWNKGKKWYR